MNRPRTWLTRHRVIAWLAALLFLIGAGVFTLQARYGDLLESYLFATKYEQNSAPEQSSIFRGEAESQNSIDDLFGSGSSSPANNRSEIASTVPTEWTLEEREFQTELNSIQATMNSLDRSPRIAEPDSFDLFQAEIRAIEQALQTIDPAKNQN